LLAVFYSVFYNSVVKKMSDDLLYVALAIVCKKKNGRKELTRSKWTKDWSLKRNSLSHTNNILHELKLEPGDWFNYLRMDEATYL
jgi:hypothetical protein